MQTQNIQIFTKRYSGNVAKLLALGRPKVNPRKELSYMDDLGIEKNDAEQLLQLANDMDIYHYEYGDVEDDEAKEFFAVIHAWKALSELKVPEAKALFSELLEKFAGEFDDYWMTEMYRELVVPYRAGMYEEAAAYIEDENKNKWVRIEYVGLVKDMLEHKEIEIEKVNMLLKELFINCKDPIVNSYAIGLCVDYQLAEHYEAIATCYENEFVDYDYLGDLEDVEISFGMRVKRDTEPKMSESMKQFKEMGDMLKLLHEDSMKEKAPASLATEVKIGRNDPCPCGSGKKYKKCCLNKR
jgi:hypothetical protein